MSLPPLDNLVKIRQLKAELPDLAEIGRLLQMAQTRLVAAFAICPIATAWF
jgi:hypothetical protein